MTIKHLSFDFWHTLAEPSLTYGTVRARVMARYYRCSVDRARAVYRAVKDHEEDLAVQRGLVCGRDDLRSLFNAAMPGDLGRAAFRDMLAELEESFIEHPPRLDLAALELIGRMRAVHGFSTSIASNTNFIIGGTVLRRLLPAGLFDFMLFSDELGCCKPAPRFFAHVLLAAGRLGGRDITSPAEILHLGDNPECDVAAASWLGIGARLVDADTSLVGSFTGPRSDAIASR